MEEKQNMYISASNPIFSPWKMDELKCLENNLMSE